jgi:Flp pilus assembly protein TadG
MIPQLSNFAGRETHKRRRGQSMVELAISFPILLLMLSGLLDLGRMYYVFVALQDATAEAALFLSVSPECQTSADTIPGLLDCTDPNNAFFRAQNAGGTTGVINFSAINTTITYMDDEPIPNGIRDIGDTVTVKMEYPFEFITPIMPRIAAINPITLTAVSAEIIVQNPD